MLRFIELLNLENFSEARQYLAEDMQFKGVLASRDGAHAYIADMEKMKIKYKVQQSFVEGSEVCVISEIKMGEAPVLTCSLYSIEGSKIKSLRVIFDPRPALDAKK